MRSLPPIYSHPSPDHPPIRVWPLTFVDVASTVQPIGGSGSPLQASIGAQLRRPDIRQSSSLAIAVSSRTRTTPANRKHQDHDKPHQRGGLPRVVIPCAAFVHIALPPARPETVARHICAAAPSAATSAGEYRRALRGLTAAIEPGSTAPFRQ